jgi:hypothetical protein
MRSERLKRTGSKERVRRALSATALMGLWIWGCGSSSDEKLRAAALAGSCSINSDCSDDLVCAFGRCHEWCTQDRDCPPGLRCMHGPTEDKLVCQLEEEVACETDRDCPAEKGASQVCGIDNECRDPCKTNDDCTPTQVCAKSGECASTYLDEVDEDGNIVKQGAGTGGSGSAGSGNTGGAQASGGGAGEGENGGRGGTGAAGAGGSGAVTQGDGGSETSESGAGGEAGDGGSSSGTAGSAGKGGAQGGRGNGGSAGTLGGAGSGGTLGGAGGGDAGSSASAGAPTGGGTTGGAGGLAGSAGTGGGDGEILTETEDGVELVDNDARETAVVAPLPSKATIYVNSYSDADWFSVTPPNDGLTHVISLTIAQDAGANSAVTAYTGADNASIDGDRVFDTGITGYAYVTAGPGATILFKFTRKNGSVTAGLAHVSFDVETENDAHEPNNAKEAATEIALGESYSGIVSAPWVTDLIRPYQDWYAVDLGLGATTFALTAVPSEGRIEVSRVSPSGATTSLGANSTGATRTFADFNVTEAGTWYLVLEPYSGIGGYSSGAKPTYLTTPYTFNVTQP